MVPLGSRVIKPYLELRAALVQFRVTCGSSLSLLWPCMVTLAEFLTLCIHSQCSARAGSNSPSSRLFSLSAAKLAVKVALVWGILDTSAIILPPTVPAISMHSNFHNHFVKVLW